MITLRNLDEDIHYVSSQMNEQIGRKQDLAIKIEEKTEPFRQQLKEIKDQLVEEKDKILKLN
jgi:hypothetical protein